MKERIKLIPINRMATPKEVAIYIVKLATEEKFLYDWTNYLYFGRRIELV